MKSEYELFISLDIHRKWINYWRNVLEDVESEYLIKKASENISWHQLKLEESKTELIEIWGWGDEVSM